MIVKLLTEHNLEFLSLTGGRRGSSESALVKLLEISCRGSNINMPVGSCSYWIFKCPQKIDTFLKRHKLSIGVIVTLHRKTQINTQRCFTF